MTVANSCSPNGSSSRSAGVRVRSDRIALDQDTGIAELLFAPSM
ncbi:hypothetical protein ACF08M_20620 [Streptomyces sp. NPDC015032]